MKQNLAAPKNKEESQGEMLDSDLSKSSAELAENTVATLFFDPEHLNQLMTGIQKSKDPSQVIGAALGQIVLVSYNKLNQADLGVDDRVWASDGGVIDMVLDEVVEFFGESGVEVNPEVVAQAVLNVLKDSPVAQGAGQQQQGQPPQGGMAAPQQEMQA